MSFCQELRSFSSGMWNTSTSYITRVINHLRIELHNPLIQVISAVAVTSFAVRPHLEWLYHPVMASFSVFLVTNIPFRQICSYPPISKKLSELVSIDSRLDQRHFKRVGKSQTVSEPHAEATLEKLLDIAVEFNSKFINDFPQSSPPFKIEDIDRIIGRIKSRTHFDAVPFLKSEREKWYRKLEKVIRNITYQLMLQKNIGNDAEIYSALATLSEMSNWCGSEYITRSLQLLLTLQGNIVEESVLDEAHNRVLDFRNYCIQRVAKPLFNQFDEDVNPHVLNEATYQVSRYIHLPLDEMAYLDWGLMFFHPLAALNPIYFSNKFFALYTSRNLINHFDELINGIKPDGRKTDVQLKREAMIDWFRDQIFSYLGTDDQNIILDKILKCVFEESTGPRANFIKIEAIEYFLNKIGIISQNDIDLTSEEEFLGLKSIS